MYYTVTTYIRPVTSACCLCLIGERLGKLRVGGGRSLLATDKNVDAKSENESEERTEGRTEWERMSAVSDMFCILNC